MGKPTIDQIRAVGDFATVFQWDLSFIKAPFPGALEGLNIRCESTELPKSSGQTINIAIRGMVVRQPGIYTPAGTLTMTFLESVDSMVSKAIAAWREMCFNMRTGAGLPKSQCEALIEIKRLDRQNNPIYGYKLVGAFLEDADLGTLDGSTSDAFRPTMIIAYDYFEDGGF